MYQICLVQVLWLLSSAHAWAGSQIRTHGDWQSLQTLDDGFNMVMDSTPACCCPGRLVNRCLVRALKLTAISVWWADVADIRVPIMSQDVATYLRQVTDGLALPVSYSKARQIFEHLRVSPETKGLLLESLQRVKSSEQVSR